MDFATLTISITSFFNIDLLMKMMKLGDEQKKLTVVYVQFESESTDSVLQRER